MQEVSGSIPLGSTNSFSENSSGGCSRARVSGFGKIVTIDAHHTPA